MARRILLSVTAAVFFAVGLLMAEELVGMGEQTPPDSVVGTVTALAADELTLKTAKDEAWKFKLNDQTKRLPGVSVGDRVRVRYKDEWGTDIATSVTTAPNAAATTRTAEVPPEGRGHMAPPFFAVGTLVSTGPSELVIATDAGERKTFVITPGMDRTHFVEGTRVRVNFENDSGHVMARAVAPASYDSARINDLPDTATSLPLVALVGMLSLLTGSALWLRRNRIS